MFIIILIISLFSLPIYSQGFQVVVAGCGGGPDENNLSSYLVAPSNSNEFVALDAGTLLWGIGIASKKGSFNGILPYNDLTLSGTILTKNIKAYLISHAHLDHVAGLVINSVVDSKKPIYGIDSTINYLRDHLFNNLIWPNFGSEGSAPILNKYKYHRLSIGEKTPIEGTAFTVQAYPLSHPGNYLSTAYLLEFQGDYLLYFGDTSPDDLEPKRHIVEVWEKIVSLIKQNRLKAIFLECSYTEKQPDDRLYGHLNAKFMMEELEQLASMVDPQNPKEALKNVTIIVTHIKEFLTNGPSSKEVIKAELNQLNDLKFQFIFPEQGDKFLLSQHS